MAHPTAVLSQAYLAHPEWIRTPDLLHESLGSLGSVWPWGPLHASLDALGRTSSVLPLHLNWTVGIGEEPHRAPARPAFLCARSPDGAPTLHRPHAPRPSIRGALERRCLPIPRGQLTLHPSPTPKESWLPLGSGPPTASAEHS